ncbi:hypothetical protein [Erwinia amylovora]
MGILHRYPVSYTHLDVYKRQLFACGGAFTPAEGFAASPRWAPVSYTHLDVYKRQLFACGGAFTPAEGFAASPRWAPVSYTHLDVYKRQAINKIKPDIKRRLTRKIG